MRNSLMMTTALALSLATTAYAQTFEANIEETRQEIGAAIESVEAHGAEAYGDVESWLDELGQELENADLSADREAYAQRIDTSSGELRTAIEQDQPDAVVSSLEDIDSTLGEWESSESGGQQQAQSGQNGGGDPSKVVVSQAGADVQVQQPTPEVQVDQSQPQVAVNQPQPEVTVTQPEPQVDVQVAVPEPQVEVDVPKPEVEVERDQPQVDVQMAQPDVQVQQPEPQVEVQQGEPDVNVEMAEPEVQVTQADPQVSVEQAEPQVSVTQPEGQPDVNVQTEQQRQDTQSAQTDAQDQQQTDTASTQQAEPQSEAGSTRTEEERTGTATAQSQSSGDATQSNSSGDTANVSAAEGRDTAAGAMATGYNAADLEGVIGMPVMGAADEEIGEVYDVIFDSDGQAQQLIVEDGGFLGIGSDLYALDWSMVEFSPEEATIRVSQLTEDMIEEMPEFEYAGGAQTLRGE